MVTRRFLTAGLGLALLSCLTEPVLKPCADFPAGAGRCPGTPCEKYCEVAIDSCDLFPSTGDAPGEASGFDRCRSACLERDIEAGEVGDESGDTLECRITHARRGECGPAALEGSCVLDCPAWCDQMESRCDGAFADVGGCLDVCPLIPRAEDGTSADANTLECRAKYAARGACDAAAVNGGGVCGAPCDMYCALALSRCAGPNAIYADEAECRQVCELLDPAGSFDDWMTSVEGDSVQCRTYHLGQPASLSPADHCPHATVFNSAHCGTACGTFCDLAETHCPDRFADRAACTEACEQAVHDTGAPPDVPGLSGACE